EGRRQARGAGERRLSGFRTDTTRRQADSRTGEGARNLGGRGRPQHDATRDGRWRIHDNRGCGRSHSVLCCCEDERPDRPIAHRQSWLVHGVAGWVRHRSMQPPKSRQGENNNAWDLTKSSEFYQRPASRHRWRLRRDHRLHTDDEVPGADDDRPPDGYCGGDWDVHWARHFGWDGHALLAWLARFCGRLLDSRSLPAGSGLAARCDFHGWSLVFRWFGRDADTGCWIVF